MSQATASRRKHLAAEFLQWQEILPEDNEIEEHHVIDGLDLVSDKPFIMNDFRESRIAWEALRKELSGEDVIVPTGQQSLKLKKVMKTLREIYRRARYDKETRDAFEIIYNNITLLWNDFLELEQMENASKTEEHEEFRQ